MDDVLLKQALIGTDRPLAANPLEENPGRLEAVESLFETVTPDSPAWRLLLQSGCYAVADRAGYEPEIDTKSSAIPAPAETRPEMSAKLMEVLFEFLKPPNEPPQIPLFFLRRVAGAGLRFPSSRLPEILAFFSVRSAFRDISRETDPDTVLSLLGERGRWLAARNTDWQWALGRSLKETAVDLAELEEIWTEGTFSERKSALSVLAEADSTTAKRLMTETWKSDKAEHREAFLNVLSGTFDDSDTEFLEAALSDRSKNVRKIAADILARLPNTDYAQRALERAERLLLIAKDGESLQIEPPKEFTKEMKTDGLEEKPPKGVGERSWWLIESTKRISPVFWETVFPQKNPSAIIASFKKDDYFESLLHAWTSAALLFPDAERWFMPLWDAWDSITLDHLSFSYEIHVHFLKQCLILSPQIIWPKIKELKHQDDMFRAELEKAWSESALMSVPWDESFVTVLFDYLHWTSRPFSFLVEFAPLFPDFAVPRLRQLLKTLENKKYVYYPDLAQKCEYMIALKETFDELLTEETSSTD